MTKPVSRRRRLGLYLWAAALLGWVGVALADVWDPYDRNQFFTSNELVHGSEQIHELGPGASSDPGGRDIDFFRIGERPLASYEVVVDGISNEILPLTLERWNNQGIPIQGSVSVSSGVARSRSLRWENSVNSSVGGSYVRVASLTECFACSSARAAYHIRAYETTYSLPRFNNNGTQTTLLIVQNMAPQPVSGSVHFWSPTGARLGTMPFSLTTKQTLVQNTASLAYAAGTSGSITISHDGRYGDLSGKAVALEPATGFVFDTALTSVPH